MSYNRHYYSHGMAPPASAWSGRTQFPARGGKEMGGLGFVFTPAIKTATVPDTNTLASASAGMSTNTKLAIGAGVLAAIYLVTRK